MKGKYKIEKITLDMFINEWKNCETTQKLFEPIFDKFIEYKREWFIKEYGANGVMKRKILMSKPIEETSDFFADL